MTPNWRPHCSDCRRPVRPTKRLRIYDYERIGKLSHAIWAGGRWRCGECLRGEFEERIALIQEGCGVSPSEATSEAKRQFEKALGNRSWEQGEMRL